MNLKYTSSKLCAVTPCQAKCAVPTILVIDNYDSFTYNLVQYLGECGAETVVKRNDEISLDEIVAMKPEGILLSPGPCTPNESGICLDILRSALAGGGLSSVPIFGVCLGCQAIAACASGSVVRASRVMHGKTSMIEHDCDGLFEGVPNPFRAVRYHSLAVDKEAVPEGFVVTATSEGDGEIMGLRHKELPIEGVQFHPESILTEHGMTIVSNFVALTQTSR